MTSQSGYTGHVDPQGAAATREAGPLTITKVSVGPMDNNAYFLRSNSTGETLLIDAANDAGTLLRLLGDADLTTIVTTHRHADHWQALAEVAKETNARLIAHPADADALPVAATDLVNDGDTITVGDVTLDVVHLVGHTPGAIALVYREPGGRPHLFTGDSLFPGGPGKTTNPEDFRSLMGHLERKIFARLPDETWVYPGHGDDTTLGTERPHLPEWRERGW
ncbi:MBL fold metallo-hydrolase [Cryptosporangium phraense]|uniref:MBL fold metallo-hydrolase n=1 Tax=Cryptosporangium phraense TaxID=2593070 RepID=A0A545AJQ4_9ACTN|nr:MBL fold metallo-hydrolase [Cryptosporangium phraense]TQS41541.1 MBL fold metallo-hydrolase [Cryptosporangium phraense]